MNLINKRLSIFALLILGFLLSSCLKETPEGIVDITDGDLILRGSFEDGAHPTSGIASVYRLDEKDYLAFELFQTDSGPDLRVYLSKDNTNSDFIDLKRLISTSGAFHYEIPEGTIIEEYNHVLIWCRAFSVLFGSAEMN